MFSSSLPDRGGGTAAPGDRRCLWLVGPPVLTQLGAGGVIEIVRARGVPEIGVHIDHADAGLMAQVQASGLQFGCWAAHSTAQITRALDLGVKVFTTDRPTLAIALRDAHARANGDAR